MTPDPADAIAGAWRLNLNASDFGFLPPPRLREDRISIHGNQITIETHQIDTNGDNRVTRHLTLDGEPCIIDVLGRSREVRAQWTGGVLHVETRWEIGGNPRRLHETWRADAGRLRIERRHEANGGAIRQVLLLDPAQRLETAASSF